MLGFLNPVVDSDDEDGNIFEPERSFPVFFNTIANQWLVKKDKSVFKLEFRFHAFRRFLKCWEKKKDNTTAKLKCRKFDQTVTLKYREM